MVYAFFCKYGSMATTRRKKKAPKIKFELSKSSVAGIAVVLSCVFLWMFLLGVWAGKTILFPEPTVAVVQEHVQQDSQETLRLTNGERGKKVY